MVFPAEFQAVVLAAGKGSRLPEITADKPKCLLPVGPKPLVWYPLQKLERSGFKTAILVILDNQQAQIEAALSDTGLKIKIDYFPIGHDDDLGTADSLRLLGDKLKSDVLVLPCDFITDVSFKGLKDLYRMYGASVVSLLFHPQPESEPEGLVIPGPKLKHNPERDVICIDPQNNRLILLASVSDFDSTEPLTSSLPKYNKNYDMHSTLIDAHCYIINNWIIKYLCSRPKISTIKGDLLPHIIQKQLSSPTEKKRGRDIFSFAKEDPLLIAMREASSGWTFDTWDSIRCFAHIAEPSDFGLRVNSLPAYWSVNNKILDKWDSITGGAKLVLRHPKAVIKSNQVDDKSIVWAWAKLGEKTAFKNANIGLHTNISSFSRVFDSIVMNNVTINEKVALENCIVCQGATIEAGAQIKNCLIGSSHAVAAGSSHSHEVLTIAERMMEFNLD